MSDFCKSPLRLSDIGKYRNALFGIAIISIIVFHYFEGVYHSPAAPHSIKSMGIIYNGILGSLGVDVFLFLSGFGIYYSLSKNVSLRDFFIKRIQRVLFPYAIFGGIFWLIKDIWLKHEPLSQFFYDYSLLSFWGNGVRVFWYISFIMLLYLISPFVYRNGSKGICGACVIWILLCTVIFTKYPATFKNIEIAILRGPVFFAGMYLGYWLKSKPDIELSKYWLICLGLSVPVKLIAAFGSFAFRRMLNGFYAVFLMFLFIWFLKVLQDRLKTLNPFLTRVGQYSLELYIVHVAIRNLMSYCGFRLYNPIPYIVCIIISIPVSLMVYSLQKNKSVQCVWRRK